MPELRAAICTFSLALPTTPRQGLPVVPRREMRSCAWGCGRPCGRARVRRLRRLRVRMHAVCMRVCAALGEYVSARARAWARASAPARELALCSQYCRPLWRPPGERVGRNANGDENFGTGGHLKEAIVGKSLNFHILFWPPFPSRVPSGCREPWCWAKSARAKLHTRASSSFARPDAKLPFNCLQNIFEITATVPRATRTPARLG